MLALLTTEMDNSLRKTRTMPHTREGTITFLFLVPRKMVIHAGGLLGFKNSTEKDTYDTDGVMLYQCKGTKANTRAVHGGKYPLFSGDCFIFSSKPHYWQEMVRMPMRKKRQMVYANF